MLHNPEYFLYQTSRLNKVATALGLTAAPSGVRLLDISENQSRDIIKYFPALIADGYGGIIVRATDGMLKDKNFDYFYPAILDAGLTIQVYGAMYANKSGIDQAKFLADTTLTLRESVDGNLVAWNDGETQDGVSVQKHRDELLKWLAEASRNFLKVGAYGSLKTWSEIYGNYVLPAQFYFWNAQWRAGTVYTLPAGISSAQLVFWQNGVWPKYAWGEQPDNLPTTEDVDMNVMPGKSMQDLRDFTGQIVIAPPPTPCPPHTHPELESAIADLNTKYADLNTRLAYLESNIVLPLQSAKYVPTEESLAYRIKGFNGKDNEIFDFYPTGSNDDVGKRIHITSPINVCIEPVYSGDGGLKVLRITDSTFLNKNKPSCPIYVDATKGHLKVA